MTIRAAQVKALALTATLAVMPLTAYAQAAMFCTNCSTIAEQLISDGKQALQYAQQLQQYATQLQQYANMVQNTVALPQQLWSQAQSVMMQVKNLSDGASLLSGNGASMMSRLNSADGYVNQLAAGAYSVANIGNQFTGWQNTIGNASSKFATSLGLQQDDLTNNAALMRAIQEHSQSAQGQMQALQAGNELAAVNGSVLLDMANAQNGLATTITTNIVVQADRQAARDAATQLFLRAPDLDTTGGKSW